MEPFSAEDATRRLAHAKIDVDPQRAEEIAATVNAFAPLLGQIWTVDDVRIADVEMNTPAPWTGVVS